MDQINALQLTAAVRQVLIFAGGFAVAKGWIDNDTMMALVPALITLGIAGYGIYLRRNNGLVASAAAVPGVASITATTAIADAVPNTKVKATS